jgi:hypothetical protein
MIFIIIFLNEEGQYPFLLLITIISMNIKKNKIKNNVELYNIK